VTTTGVPNLTDTTARLRQGLVLLAALGIVGTAVELAMLRHWNGFDQRLPWAGLVVGAVALAFVARPARLGARALRIVRAASIAVAVLGLVGVWVHAHANYEAGPLDRDYGATWTSLSATSRWWKAVNGDVGPAPTLAPAVLVQIALSTLLATVGLGRGRVPRSTVGRPPVQAADPPGSRVGHDQDGSNEERARGVAHRVGARADHDGRARPGDGC